MSETNKYQKPFKNLAELTSCCHAVGGALFNNGCREIVITFPREVFDSVVKIVDEEIHREANMNMSTSVLFRNNTLSLSMSGIRYVFTHP